MIELTSLNQALQLLEYTLSAKKRPPIHFLSHRGTDAFALKAVLDRIGYPLDTVICLDDTDELELLGAKRVISLERMVGRRALWYGMAWYGGVLQKLLSFEERDLPPGSLLFCFSNNSELEAYCKKRRIGILSANAVLRELFEDKLQLTRLLAETNLPLLPQIVAPLGNIEYGKCRRFFEGRPLVFQRPKGGSGTGTDIIETEGDLTELRPRYPPETVVKVTPKIPGYTYAITGCITEYGIVWRSPAVQIIGEAVVNKLSRSPTTYAGSDFAAGLTGTDRFIDPRSLDIFGKALYKNGYRGLFNVDVLSNGGYIVDLNARCPGSIRLITDLELINDDIPLILHQILHFLGCRFRTVSPRPFRTAGSMTVLHSLSSEPFRCAGTVTPGIYRETGDTPAYMGPARGFDELADAKSFLVTGGMPKPGVIVQPEAPLCRIWFRRGIVDENMQVQSGALRPALWVFSRLCEGR